MKPKTLEDLTPDELIKRLVETRLTARRTIIVSEKIKRTLELWNARLANLPQGLPEYADAARTVAELQESSLGMKFAKIGIGTYLSQLCDQLDQKVRREAIFDALNTNPSDRDTDMVREHGEKTIYLINVLDLENSATKSDGIEIRPLKWCTTMAMMHAMRTNSALDRAIHDGANEFFGGAFGEYRERPLIERLIGQPI